MGGNTLINGRFRIRHSIFWSPALSRYTAHDEKDDFEVALELVGGPHSPMWTRQALAKAIEKETARGTGGAVQPAWEVVHLRPEDGGVVAVVRQMDGEQSLAEVLSEASRMSMPRAVRMLRAMALAMGQLHAAGTAHGMLCPDVIVVQNDGSPCLLASGLHPILEDLRAADLVGGQPWSSYMAPELREGSPLNPLMDVYAFGRLMLDILGGNPADWPQHLLDLQRACTTSDPARRPQTTATLIERLGPMPGAFTLADNSEIFTAVTAPRMAAAPAPVVVAPDQPPVAGAVPAPTGARSRNMPLVVIGAVVLFIISVVVATLTVNAINGSAGPSASAGSTQLPIAPVVAAPVAAAPEAAPPPIAPPEPAPEAAPIPQPSPASTATPVPEVATPRSVAPKAAKPASAPAAKPAKPLKNGESTDLLMSR
jgi:Protein tyrosine and serine/threonine kinase